MLCWGQIGRSTPTPVLLAYPANNVFLASGCLYDEALGMGRKTNKGRVGTLFLFLQMEILEGMLGFKRLLNTGFSQA